VEARFVLSVSQPKDHRDLVIDDLVISEAALLDRIADLEIDVRALGETLQAAAEALYFVTAERDRLRRKVRDLTERLRTERAA
jgi:hypothetical protein